MVDHYFGYGGAEDLALTFEKGCAVIQAGPPVVCMYGVGRADYN